jgi:hypothetical protein
MSMSKWENKGPLNYFVDAIEKRCELRVWKRTDDPECTINVDGHREIDIDCGARSTTDHHSQTADQREANFLRFKEARRVSQCDDKRLVHVQARRVW